MKAIEDIQVGGLVIVEDGGFKPWRFEKACVIGVSTNRALKGEAVILFKPKANDNEL